MYLRTFHNCNFRNKLAPLFCHKSMHVLQALRCFVFIGLSTHGFMFINSEQYFFLVYDDVEGESGQNRLMVGSMNGASKFTKGEGEEEQLGGTIYTKNLKNVIMMPEKIVEGKNNWLLMEKNPCYEEKDMGDNCERNF